MPDSRIDPHLRHDFSHPPPWLRPPPNPPRPLRSRTRRLWPRLRLWWRRLEYRLGRWLVRHLQPHGYQERAALHLLIVALTLIVIFQAVLLVLTGPR